MSELFWIGTIWQVLIFGFMPKVPNATDHLNKLKLQFVIWSMKVNGGTFCSSRHEYFLNLTLFRAYLIIIANLICFFFAAICWICPKSSTRKTLQPVWNTSNAWLPWNFGLKWKLESPVAKKMELITLLSNKSKKLFI